MSGADVKKPETKEEFIKMLTEAAKKEVGSKNKPTKPTIIGTAKEMEIHRDTLYSWLKEFNVDFKEILDRMPTVAGDALTKIQAPHTLSANRYWEKETKSHTLT